MRCGKPKYARAITGDEIFQFGKKNNALGDRDDGVIDIAPIAMPLGVGRGRWASGRWNLGAGRYSPWPALRV